MGALVKAAESVRQHESEDTAAMANHGQPEDGLEPIIARFRHLLCLQKASHAPIP
jgi:hypothetical protein